MSQYHFDPDTYDALMAEEVPLYSRLQHEVAAATVDRTITSILDLGTGTGTTASIVLGLHPHAGLTGVDVSEEMLARAAQVLPAKTELKVASLEGPLPQGRFDLVMSALAVHHLNGPGKRDLFRRIAEALASGGRFVLGDLIVPDDPADIVTPIDGIYDMPSRASEQLDWLREAGLKPSITWIERDLAVLVGDR